MTQRRLDDLYGQFFVMSGRFSRSAVGDLNFYPLFVELADQIMRPSSRVGLIIKSGMMVSPTCSDFSGYLLDNNRLQSVFDFRNWKGWFPAVGYHEQFSLLTLRSGSEDESLVFGYYLDDPSEVSTAEKTFTIARREAIALNPITKTVPPFVSTRDKEVVLGVYRRFPILASVESEWGIRYSSGIHMTSEADKLKDLEELQSLGCQPDELMHMHYAGGSFVPLYEGKYIHQFDHRFASFEGIPREKRFGIKAGTYMPSTSQKADPEYHITPRYWVSQADALENAERRKLQSSWAIAFRAITNVISDYRTCIASVCDTVAFNYGVPNLILGGFTPDDLATSSLLFVSMMNSIPFDYIVRQKLYGANFTKSIIVQLAAPPISAVIQWKAFIIPRSLELTYTSSSLKAFALDCGYSGVPFVWDDKRRFSIRCELDALFFHIYSISRDDVDYILDSFPILRNKDLENFGEFRTKRVVLEMYDSLHEEMRNKVSYSYRPEKYSMNSHSVDHSPDSEQVLPRASTPDIGPGTAAPPIALSSRSLNTHLLSSPTGQAAIGDQADISPEAVSVTPAYARTSAEDVRPAGFQVGDRVRHSAFGEGRVTAVVSGNDGEQVTVQFVTGRPRQFIAGLAKLERV